MGYLTDEQLAHAIAFDSQQEDDAKLAKEISHNEQVEQDAADAAFARQLAANGSGMDQSLSRSVQLDDSHATRLTDSMLLIAAEIGECEVEMLVDTGAQMSVISEPLANRLGLLSGLDTRRQGMATGVGQAKILGHVSNVQVKLGHVEFALTFAVLQQQTPLMLLGLDQLRLFKCLVDLEKNCLVFGGHGGVEVSFVAGVVGSVSSPADALLAQAGRAIEIFQQRDRVAARAAMNTMKQILLNVLRNPSEAKYRCLRGTNMRLQREVYAHPEIVEMLKLAGFIRDEDSLLLPPGTPLLAVRKLVELCNSMG